MKLTPAVLLSATLCASVSVLAEPITLLHSWQTPSELKALNILEKDVIKKGLTPEYQMPTTQQRHSSTEIRILANELSTQATLISLPIGELQQWYDLRLLHSLSGISQEQDWPSQIPQSILNYVTHRGEIIAAPIAVHISNWVWANKQLIDATGLTLDNDWDNFLTILTKLQDQGVIPIAHDGSVDQDILLFETLYLSMFGAEKYTELFGDLNANNLRKAVPDFSEVFTSLASLKPFISRQPENTPWSDTAQLISSAQAGLVIQGDWLRGEFTLQGKIANQHYYCTEFPGKHQTVSLRVDAISTLNINAHPVDAELKTFLSSVVNKNNQYLFNNYKGGLPAIQDTGIETISECLTFAVQRIEQAQTENGVVPSLSQGVAVRDVVRQEIGTVINEFMTNNVTPEDAAKQLQKRMKYASYLIN
jgi:glucose/mannose transport system substrate-binding protein